MKTTIATNTAAPSSTRCPSSAANQIDGSRSPTSDPRSPISDLPSPISELRPPISAPALLTGAEILRILLERQGIRTLSGIPGGAILPFYDALQSPQSSIEHILARHEQGGGFIAHGMSRVTGRAAVCLATSGPGATNLVTAIADARLDSIPLIAITAQVPQSLIGTDAFQEVDTYGLTLPITKHNFLVRSAAELLEVIPLAFTLAESGRPGPVAIDIPKDVFNAKHTVAAWPAVGRGLPTPPCPDADIAALAHLLVNARRPVLYLGGGIIASGAADLARELAHRLPAPIVSTLMALGAIPSDDPLFMGMLGMHGTKATGVLLEEADLVLAIGARFDDRATGKVAEFCPRATIAHIDIDRAEIGKIKNTFLGLTGDAADILRRLLAQLPPRAQLSNPPPQGHREKPHDEATQLNSPHQTLTQLRQSLVGTCPWIARAAELRAAHPLIAPPRAEDPLHPINLCRFLGETLPANTIVTTDVGQHQMWVAQAWPFRQPRTFLTSGGLGTMGFGLPAAIGAALAVREEATQNLEPGTLNSQRPRRVVCISGDGSILMNIQELATLAELDLPVAVLIFNNGALGLVRQQQELFYRQNYSASRFHAAPDFAALARAFGLRGLRIESTDTDPLATIAAALAAPGPIVIDIPIHATTNVYPMVPPGAANHQTITAQPILSHAHA
jgi:acetolactate synthase-1/2/3 large subunit